MEWISKKQRESSYSTTKIWSPLPQDNVVIKKGQRSGLAQQQVVTDIQLNHSHGLTLRLERMTWIKHKIQSL